MCAQVRFFPPPHMCFSTSPPLPRCTLSRGEVMMTEDKNKEGREAWLAVWLSHLVPMSSGIESVGVGLSLQLRFCSACLLKRLNGAGMSKPVGDKWPTSLSMSFQYNLGINYTNWYCTVINIHLYCGPHARECMRICEFVRCITLTEQILERLHRALEWFHLKSKLQSITCTWLVQKEWSTHNQISVTVCFKDSAPSFSAF